MQANGPAEMRGAFRILERKLFPKTAHVRVYARVICVETVLLLLPSSMCIVFGYFGRVARLDGRLTDRPPARLTD